MIISIVAAMDRNRLIGNNNQLPWHLPADLAHFKRITMGKPIVMGRKTFESIGRPLPGRTNIVLTRGPGFDAPGIKVCHGVDELDTVEPDADEIMIIGGSTIYQQMLAHAQRMYITFVDGVFDGDAWFPEFDDSGWQIIEDTSHPADENNAYSCRFVTYQRK